MRYHELIVESQVPTYLYHTTYPATVIDILQHGALKPKDYDSFVSFSALPHVYDITGQGACLIFHAAALAEQVEQVQYTERWAANHPAQMSFIAGEGWSEQWEAPDDIYDDEGEEDEDAYEAAQQEAELDAFLWKSNEREFISRVHGQPVSFPPTAVHGLIVEDDAEEWRVELDKLGYHHVNIEMRASG